MKVLFWLRSFPAVSETFIRNQIVDLIDNGIDVQIFCNSKNEDIQGLEGFEKYDLLNKTIDFKDILPQSNFKKIKSFFKILLNHFLTFNFWYFIKLLRLLLIERKSYSFSSFFILNYILAQKINVIHCHFGPIGKKAVFIKKIDVPVKLICTFHGYDIRLGIKRGKMFYSDLFSYADSILSISNYNKEMLLSFGLNPKKMEDLNNGVAVSSEKKHKEKRNEEVQILAVGRLVEEKGYDLALNAISGFRKKNPEVKFRYDIIGGGHLEKILKQKCKDLNIESLITFHLSQNSEFVKSRMQNSDFLLLSSLQEAIPTVILEAQAYSLPVLATNVGSVRDLVINDKTGFLSEVSEEALITSLERMFKNKNKWEFYGANAKRNIILNYDKNKLTQKLIKIYQV